MPVLVASVTGVFRSGKSFLLNLMVTYLEHNKQSVSSHGFSKYNVCLGRYCRYCWHAKSWEALFVFISPFPCVIPDFYYILIFHEQQEINRSYSSPIKNTVLCKQRFSLFQLSCTDFCHNICSITYLRSAILTIVPDNWKESISVFGCLRNTQKNCFLVIVWRFPIECPCSNPGFSASLSCYNTRTKHCACIF